MVKLKKNKVLVLLVTVLPALLGMPVTAAQNKNEKIEVRAKVPYHFEFDLIDATSEVIIKKNNIKKGVLDIKKGFIVSVITNNANGYSFLISSQEISFYASAIISINDGRTFEILPNGSVEISMPFSGPQEDITQFDFKIFIPQDMEQGEYIWPFVLSVHPL